MNQKKLLLVEDDLNLGIVLKDFLEMEGFIVTHCNDGRSGLEAFLNDTFHLAILDVMLPFIDGFTLAEKIRKQDKKIPLIFLTAKSMKEDKIRGFKTGGDDYITKPFSTEELILRINAVLRRTEDFITDTNKTTVFNFGEFEFDSNEQILSHNGNKRQLTKRESDVLRMLCTYKNKLLKREIALKEIWGENDYFMGRSMDVYITKLRKMLKDDPKVTIVNVHNAGFKLMVEV
ncbi:MAG: response regulator transcription factor [Bacteroidales bacterium]|nr:response regulator transcription factor [Bacteroidales bacterium]